MRFTKHNNPSKKRHRRPIDRTTADIIAGKKMIDFGLSVEEADKLSDKLCNKPSRKEEQL